MDWDDLLDGLVPDMARDPDTLPANPDLPETVTVVEDGEVQTDQLRRLEFLRDYAVMVYGTAVIELAEWEEDDDEDEGTLTISLCILDSVDITIERDPDQSEGVRVWEGHRELEKFTVESHSGEQDSYGPHFGVSNTEAAEAAEEAGESPRTRLDISDFYDLPEDQHGQ